MNTVSFLRMAFCAAVALTVSLPAAERGNVIFIHPDGTGLGHWNAARWLQVGPDGMLNWDRMEQLASYRVHQKNWLSTSSHAGATTHAYGKKVHYDSYGLDRTEPLTALSGASKTIMQEARDNGVRVGIVNSGHIGEPGTGVFLASNEQRSNVTEIAADIFASGADLIFCGGEVFCLPEGTVGRHGREGVRTDGRNLLAEAATAGYTVIYTREELLQLGPDTEKVIGIFAAEDTYNDDTESALQQAGLQPYDPEAPTFDELVAKAMEILGSDPNRRFFLVAEEEGTDNFSNDTNASGMLQAMERADAAIGEALAFQQQFPFRHTLLLVGADSDAGHPAVWAPRGVSADFQLPPSSESGAAMDGINGTGGQPFLSRPDQFGNRYPFGIAWATAGDFQGSGVSRAHGFQSELLGTNVDNTDLYKIMYTVLFGHAPE